ncbi:MAG: presqualene diphosphate synthase HpnD [Pseudomonadota bacterium]|nr:presqualene diphosphate synthase HpnD [Pseudomonadota bacterium]
MSLSVPYSRAIAEVKARVKASRTSFHAGMMALPRARREAMYAVYAFCREVDDIADDSPTQEECERGLQSWRERIRDLFARGATDECITVALAPAIPAFQLVEEDFQAIIDGMEMDSATTICAPDMRTLDVYCDRVASAVGRISVRVFGDSGAKAMQVAHHLGRAFQLTNILRDLGEDAARGRLYLPEEFLARHGIASRVPRAVLEDPQLPAVCRDLAAEAMTHFRAADEFMRACSDEAMRPARIMRGYYGAILERLLRLNWGDPFTRVSLPKWQKAWLALRTLLAKTPVGNV